MLQQNSRELRGEIVEVWLEGMLLTMSRPRESGDDEGRSYALLRQFNTRLLSGLSSEKVGTSISNFSPLSFTI